MNPAKAPAPLRIALGGFGNVARQLVRAITARPELGLEIGAISARDLSAAKVRAQEIGLDVPVVSAEQLPQYCPVIVECATYDGFRAIGRAFDSGIDVACLPLGAYEPRWFMGSQHMAPEESLQTLLDLGAKHMVGMHWGTFDLTDEPSDAGPKLLAQTIKARGLDASRFHVLRPGGALEFHEAEVSPRACFVPG